MSRCWRAKSVVLGLLVAGCTVKPGPDYRQAATLISQRTGAPEVYDPQSDGLVEQKLEALLARPLTVEGAVAVGLLNNRQLQSAFFTIGVSRADLVQAGLFANPSFTLLDRLPAGGGRADVEISPIATIRNVGHEFFRFHFADRLLQPSRR